MSGGVDVDKELLPFLSSSARHDLKFFAIQYFVGLSGTPEGVQFITSKQIYVDRVIELALDNVTNVVKEAITCLINLAGDNNGAKMITDSPRCTQFMDSILNSVVQRGCLLADPLSMLLSNLTRTEEGSKKAIDILTGNDPPTTFDELIQVMCLVGYNKHADLNFLAPFLSNLCQTHKARMYFLDQEKCVIKKLFPFTQHQSEIRRQAISTILKNCCFEAEAHDWLLSPAVDILPCLLLPLAGPEELDEDDMDKLPPELQYLEPEKTREPIAAIRANLLEALTQLCATQIGRKWLKDHNTYVIIREYHKWEKVPTNHPLIMNLVDILIGEEPDKSHGTSNLKDIHVPEHLQKQFNEESEAEIKALTDDTQ